jgi:hypothetical protein
MKYFKGQMKVVDRFIQKFLIISKDSGRNFYHMTGVYILVGFIYIFEDFILLP